MIIINLFFLNLKKNKEYGGGFAIFSNKSDENYNIFEDFSDFYFEGNQGESNFISKYRRILSISSIQYYNTIELYRE